MSNSSFAEEFEFHHLAQRPWYKRCPEWLVENCGIESPSMLVDLGCGSGSLTQMLLNRFTAGDGLRIVGIDPSEPELKIASKAVTDERVQFVQGRAQDLPQLVQNVDSVLMCNVLHLIPEHERPEVFQHIYRVLKPGGTCAFNTLYYEGDIVPETRKFYSAWMLCAFETLRRQGIHARADRHGVSALQRLTPEQHRDLLVAAGFGEVLIEEPIFQWTVNDWKALSRYSIFIQNTLRNIDLDKGSTALQVGVAAAYRELNLEVVPRRFLHVAARKIQ
ncbi:MAG TPA: methyltransferase domain-containing protein [Thermoanaerobaculia bacterium]|nr:methyltransferase domain-containing protein [Thermoanaerobaculia bacterium]